MKKDNKSQENIYLLMKERLGKYMNEGVEQDLREISKFRLETNNKGKSVQHKLLIQAVLNHFSGYEISPAYFYSINLS